MVAQLQATFSSWLVDQYLRDRKLRKMYHCLQHYVQEAIHLRLLSSELDPTLNARLPVTIFEDNKAAIAMSENPVNHEETKHIFVKYDFKVH